MLLCLDIGDRRGVSREQHGVSLGHFLSRPQDTGSAARTVVAASRATPREAMGWNMVGESRRVWLAPVFFEPVVAGMASGGGYLSTREGGSWNARKRCRRRCGDGCGLIHSAPRDYALEPEPDDGEVECRPNRQNGSGSKPRSQRPRFFSAGRGRRLQCETGSRGEREVQSGASIRFAMEMAMDFFPVRMTDSERAGGEEWSEPQKRGKRVARKR